MKDLLDYGVSVLSTCWSLENIDSLLGIILLIFSIANIVFKAILQIKNKIDNKKYNEIPEIIEDVIEDIKEIKKEE